PFAGALQGTDRLYNFVLASLVPWAFSSRNRSVGTHALERPKERVDARSKSALDDLNNTCEARGKPWSYAASLGMMDSAPLPEGFLPELPPILTADSITRVGPEAAGALVVNGSHGGLYAAYLAAKLGVAAAIFNNAGVGLDQAGIAG